MLNVNLNDHFWNTNLSTGKTGTTSTLILTILNSNYVLYIHSNLINVLQNYNLTAREIGGRFLGDHIMFNGELGVVADKMKI